jgi:lysophospholipase L1-like esterase
MKSIVLVLIVAAALRAQAPTALLPAAGFNQLCERSTQLLEAGGVVVPDLARAAAPVIENVRQACAQLSLHPGQGQATYTVLMNVRAYLTLADAVPKPFPFPETARLQFAEMRDNEARLDAHFRALLENKESQLVTADRDNLARYSEENRRLGAPQPGKPRVVFLGDSITDLWRLNEYFPDRDFVNRGISGQITGQMLGRMKADVIDLHPAAVVILGGTNDLAREIPLTAIEDNYLLLADVAAAAKVKVILASVLPVSDFHKDADPSFQRTTARPPVFIKALNEWLMSFCAQRGYTFLNYVPALSDPQGQLGEDLSDDGLHPNSKGYRLMAPLVLQAVDRAVAPPPVVRAPAPAPAAAPASAPASGKKRRSSR